MVRNWRFLVHGLIRSPWCVCFMVLIDHIPYRVWFGRGRLILAVAEALTRDPSSISILFFRRVVLLLLFIIISHCLHTSDPFTPIVHSRLFKLRCSNSCVPRYIVIRMANENGFILVSVITEMVYSNPNSAIIANQESGSLPYETSKDSLSCWIRPDQGLSILTSAETSQRCTSDVCSKFCVWSHTYPMSIDV